TLVLRLRDNVMKMGEDLEQAAETEARETETAKRFQLRMEEMKVEMDELVEREQEASRRCMELVRTFDSTPNVISLKQERSEERTHKCRKFEINAQTSRNTQSN
ncbi:hypothetical protein scyTo_0021591, partial [Scyliorhinus torazame]|nr:hypothetical protein [Scyliorhinus torazame]